MTASLYKHRRQSKIRRRRVVRFLKLMLFLFLIWFIGLVWFVGFKLAPTELSNHQKTDGIVVLTGGVGRIEAGIEALNQGVGKRLLISGVNASLQATTIFNAYGITPDHCQNTSGSAPQKCTDLGREALDTRGNAQEAKQWAEENNFSSLMVITSEYHMRRALLEFKSVSPQMKILPFVVATKLKWTSISLEYTKYLFSLIKNIIFS